MSEGHVAKRWVEEHYPSVQGDEKARLILAFGGGLDAGLAEAQEIVLAETESIKQGGWR
jgi:hypothetical protein